ncbi:hypothetical protein PCANC_16953 [Puccinia coronata f. sp. avenae]|uniref:Uncharacterized protein n=1 Tax=Puccinia coronata f. sp. avenae TaxID=200324 RepID=A0A2N5V5W7_9BASI|nr:hypothetical protein PCANC_16953 [Puccinia coronata f. sp. avenae]
MSGFVCSSEQKEIQARDIPQTEDRSNNDQPLEADQEQLTRAKRLLPKNLSKRISDIANRLNSPAVLTTAGTLASRISQQINK